jgi:ATP-binding protein involved in chromosome partitioning
MSWFTPPELPDKKYYLFGNGGGEILSKEFDLPLLANIPMYESVMNQANQNLPGHTLMPEEVWNHFLLLAGEVARNMAIKNAIPAHTS